MNQIAILAVAIALFTSEPVIACSRVPYEHIRPPIDAEGLPERMVTRATFVEIVVAESRSLFDVDAWQQKNWAADLAAAPNDAALTELKEDMAWERKSLEAAGLAQVQFRVVERIKGSGVDVFTLNAFSSPTAWKEFNPQLAAGHRGGYTDPHKVYDAPHWVQADKWGGLGSCMTPLTAVVGQRYLIFRGSGGGLLGEQVKFGPYNENWAEGSVFEPIDSDDPWLARVRAAAPNP